MGMGRDGERDRARAAPEGGPCNGGSGLALLFEVADALEDGTYNQGKRDGGVF